MTSLSQLDVEKEQREATRLDLASDVARWQATAAYEGHQRESDTPCSRVHGAVSFVVPNYGSDIPTQSSSKMPTVVEEQEQKQEQKQEQEEQEKEKEKEEASPTSTTTAAATASSTTSTAAAHTVTIKTEAAAEAAGGVAKAERGITPATASTASTTAAAAKVEAAKAKVEAAKAKVEVGATRTSPRTSPRTRGAAATVTVGDLQLGDLTVTVKHEQMDEDNVD